MSPGFASAFFRTNSKCFPGKVELQNFYGYSVAGNVLVIGASVTLCWDAVVL
jgi:hypothetical protein